MQFARARKLILLEVNNGRPRCGRRPEAAYIVLRFLWKTLRVFNCLPDQGEQVVAHAADRATVIVEALSPVNTIRRLCKGEAPPW